MAVDFDWSRKSLVAHGGAVALSAQQSDLFYMLWKSIDTPVLFARLIAGLYGAGDEPESARAVIKTQIAQIRGKLKHAGVALDIICVRDRGYMLRKIALDDANFTSAGATANPLSAAETAVLVNCSAGLNCSAARLVAGFKADDQDCCDTILERLGAQTCPQAIMLASRLAIIV